MEVRSALSAQGSAAPDSQFASSDHDKVFLKHCKVVREIWKLEEQKSSGKSLDALQEQKLNKKSAALKDVREMLESLPRDSVLRQRNEGVIEAAMAEVDVPEPVPALVESQVKIDEGVAEVARTPAVVQAQRAAEEEWQRPSATADENNADNAMRGESPGEPHVDVDDEKHADGKKSGKPRRKRAGVSHNERKRDERECKVAGS